MPKSSFYRWEGRAEQSTEFWLTIKLFSAHNVPMETHIMERHPYAVFERIAVPVCQIGEKYLSWAQGDSTSFLL